MNLMERTYMKNMTIPYSFICDLITLNWRDILWGYENQLIGWSYIVHIAIDRLVAGSQNALEIELSCLGKSETHRISELLCILANNESDDTKIFSQKKWLFLVLSWLYSIRDYVADPLAEVENIYSDFGYPTEIEAFVRYMPVTDGYDPRQHTIQENKDRLYSKWEQYLSKAMQEIRGSN
jgi:hypothetical protein